MPGGVRSMVFSCTNSDLFRWPAWVAAAVLLSSLLLATSGCSSPGDEAPASEQAALTPDQLRVLHQRGLKARDREIFDVALSYFNEASDGGYGPASVASGKLYATGFEGVPQDAVEAARRYRLAVDQGAGYRAELPLGALYLDGVGLAQDLNEAERWFRRGALTLASLEGVVKQGEEATAEGGAQQLIASLFHPHPVPERFGEALAWARELDTWESDLLYEVGGQYREGGTTVDPVLAEALLKRAAAKGNPEAAYTMARRKLDAEDGARDEVAGIDLLWQAAQGDLVVAQRELAEIYAEADRDPLDRQRAYYWLVRAQRNGAEVEEAIDDLASELSEEQRRDVIQTLEDGEAYLP